MDKQNFVESNSIVESNSSPFLMNKRFFRSLLIITGFFLVYSCLLIFFRNMFPELLWKAPEMLLFISTIILSLTIWFRVYFAFGKWQRDRMLLEELVETSKKLGFKLHAFLPREQRMARKFFAVMIPNFSYSLKIYFKPSYNFEDLEDWGEKLLAEIKESEHVPNKIIFMLLERLNLLAKGGVLSGNQLAVLTKETDRLLVIQEKFERYTDNKEYCLFSWFAKGYMFLYFFIIPMYLEITSYSACVITGLVFAGAAGLIELAGEMDRTVFSDGKIVDQTSLAIVRNIR